MAYDLLIKNGCIVDGSGEPAFHADVAVHQGKIVGVGKSNGAAAESIARKIISFLERFRKKTA